MLAAAILWFFSFTYLCFLLKEYHILCFNFDFLLCGYDCDSIFMSSCYQQIKSQYCYAKDYGLRPNLTWISSLTFIVFTVSVYNVVVTKYLKT